MPYGIMPSGRLRFLGEKYEDWVYAIRDLAEAVELWDLLNPSPNSAELKKRITRPKEVYALDIGPKPSSLWDLHRREYVPKPSLRYNYREIASPIIRPELIDEFPNGVIKVAKITLANMITGKLRCYVAQELSVTAESEYHLFAYSQKPSCLLGALWLQLVDEVMGFKIGKICERERCGQHFIMADSRSKYCSRSCNTLAHVVR
jgi:hypothetical protein